MQLPSSVPAAIHACGRRREGRRRKIGGIEGRETTIHARRNVKKYCDLAVHDTLSRKYW